MAPALWWLLAFFDDVHGPLVRAHHVHSRHLPVEWIITADASPWGVGQSWRPPVGRWSTLEPPSLAPPLTGSRHVL
eukprot:12733032-Alexandrium_andersonii.AAC.1